MIANDDGGEEVVEGIRIRPCRFRLDSRMAVLLFATWQFWRECVTEDADIYQLHSPELLPLGVALKWRGKIVVYDAHEDLPNHILEKEWLPGVLRSSIAALSKRVLEFALRRFDAVVTPHEHVADALRAINSHVEVVANFAKVLSPVGTTAVPMESRRPVVCYSGTMYHHSNQEEILTAIVDLPDIEYHVAGHFPDHLRRCLSGHAAFGRLVFHGRLPWESLREFYAAAVVGIVVIGFTRNLGGRQGTNAVNKLFEYLEAGLPVICSGTHLWRDIIEQYQCGICVEPGDVSQIREAISTLVGDRALAAKMGANGRRAVVERFNWAVEEQKYLKVFDSLSDMLNTRRNK
jgi:glycosyltransferase involved in cell wall biosynthesis